MIALYLLAAHLVGDYVLQTRWQATGKFGWDRAALGFRTRHVAAYSLCFVPIVAVYASSWDGGATFLAALFLLHWMTDAQRFSSTLGDIVGWRLASPEDRARAVGEARGPISSTLGMPPELIYAYPPPDVERKLRLPPNPWPTIGLALDQTSHIVQIAVLAGLLLS